ncbi:MAG TPA: glycosyltransferase [Dehalococcoidia bacterium]|nr:glycosyltransferase [Dehalococcoidia bacterium]
MKESPPRAQAPAAAPADDPLLNLPFDHYERYALTRRLVDHLFPGRNAPLRVLDVGGHLSSLKHFLPDDIVTLADPQSPPTFTYRESVPFEYDTYVMAAGGTLPFTDASFDLVTAHDTLEHVPPEDRPAFLRDIIRVSRRFVVLNGPVHRPEAAEAEQRLARFLEHNELGHNVSLDDHLALGLPATEDIEAVLHGTGLPWVGLPNGKLPLWLFMMGVKHYLISLPHSDELHQEADRIYNTLFAPTPFGGLCYRRAYVIAKRPEDAALLSEIDALFAGDVAGAGLPLEMPAVTRLIDLLEGHSGQVRGDFRHLRDWITRKDASIAHLNSAVAQIEQNLRAANAQLSDARWSLREHEQQLAAIRSSRGYRFLEAYRRPVRWLFPRGSRRAAPYRAAVRAADWSLSRAARSVAMVRRARGLAARSRAIIRNEGARAFLRRARRKAMSTLRRRAPVTTSIPITYEDWIVANEPGWGELESQRRTSLLLPHQPLISIITPVWNPGPELLRKTIESVILQTYENWELCLADGGSGDPGVRAALQEAAARDARIKVQFLGENRGISGNSNAALDVATGDYVAFLDHTDTLAPNALWEVAALLNRDPAADCIYSDHDLISNEDVRHQPLFKPEFSPEMLYSANYLAHFCALRKDLVDRLGRLRSETDGAQDWDLVLRAAAAGARFARIPKVLYHWRTDPGSAVTSPENKPYALRAQERAIQDHLDACRIPGTVVRDEYGGPAIKLRPSGSTRVTIIIPTRHNCKVLEPCLRSIARSTYKNWEIIVVDSAGRTAERERWYERLQKDIPLNLLWWDRPFNFSAVNNLAASQAQGDALLFLNDDTEARSPGWLDEMVGWLEQDGIGAVGAQLTFASGAIQHGGDVLGLQGFADHLFTGAGPNDWTLFGSTRWYRNLTATTGACLLVRAGLFRHIGGFNERFHLCGSDVALCIQVRRAGYRILCTPFAGVIHHERSTRGNWDVRSDAFTSFWHYQSFLNGGDPYFSPNLSIFSSIPQLRHPDEPTPTQVVSPIIGRELPSKRQGSADIETEATTLVEWCQIQPGEIDANLQLHESNSDPFDVRSINWFIPDMVSPFYGGIHTILRFAAHFKDRYGITSRFVVMGSGPEEFVRSGITAAFPQLADCDIRICSLAEGDIRSQPYADISIATLWVTAYAVSKFANTKRKFYMVQDYEPVFYPAGTLYALSEATYRLGLYGLCNTSTLRDIYVDQYSGKAFGFVPAVDTALFHPPEGSRHDDDTMLVFLYGRPGHWRNCYELAIATLRRLKQRLKRKVRIVTAGSWVTSGDSESAYLVDNLGLLDYRETADLYRKCHVGLTLSVSKHPSYLPLELMASGVLVVSNYNPSGFWLLHDQENCLLAEPTAESLCAALERALTDDALRDRLSKQAVADIQARHTDWPSQIDAVYRYICDPENRSPEGAR